MDLNAILVSFSTWLSAMAYNMAQVTLPTSILCCTVAACLVDHVLRQGVVGFVENDTLTRITMISSARSFSRWSTQSLAPYTLMWVVLPTSSLPPCGVCTTSGSRPVDPSRISLPTIVVEQRSCLILKNFNFVQPSTMRSITSVYYVARTSKHSHVLCSGSSHQDSCDRN